MREIDFLKKKHSSVKRNYLKRILNKNIPKHKAATIAKKWGYDYWDGSRDINYGGYYYKEGFWTKIAKSFIKEYNLNNSSKILDVGCGKGFLLYDIKKILPDIEIAGIDISKYAILNAKPEIKKFIKYGNAKKLPFVDNTFDFVYSLNTIHNLYTYDLISSIKEIERVSKKDKYICVESYKNEKQKVNLMLWQVTCEAFYTPKEWKWWFNLANYTGDYSFIYFN